ncbi:sulfotransferase [Nonomuraea sp. NPDC005650]|uniref:sulfotransferase family protein n=1 Tax=Nonomuraea sp. NPDC005650 TaxID=3157045 RepID=UPI0033B5298F
MKDHTSGESGMVRGNIANGPAAPDSPDRLLQSPVIVLSPPRSGSTLLRAILGSHTRMHAPHEPLLSQITVTVPLGPAAAAMTLLGHDQEALQHLLWDRLLHLELTRSGKPTLVLKSPTDTLVWPRLAACWPDARFVFLLRHPAAILASWREATGLPAEPSTHLLGQFTRAVDEARQELPGTTVRYEQLVADPATVMAGVCERLGVAYEPGMLHYGHHVTGPFVRGVGDWLDKIHTGRIQPARPTPAAELPEPLAGIVAAWDYT